MPTEKYRGQDALAVYTVFDKPANFPSEVVVCKQYVFSGKVHREPNLIFRGPSVAEARQAITTACPEAVCILRESGDEESLVETWV